MWKHSALLLLLAASSCLGCGRRNSPTTASGSKAPKGPFCSGQLIFQDDFDRLDRSVWKHENTVGGGGNNEFQWYSGSDKNSYVRNGYFFIRPTLTADEFGEQFLSSGTIDLNKGSASERCTDSPGWAEQIQGCQRSGTRDRILNPVRSARVRTKDTFAFKYGTVEINAKMPKGDWLWPALWLLPQGDTYGTWPKSGEIDIVESRGNQNLVQNQQNIGVQQVSSCLHFGENSNLRSSQCKSSNQYNFADQFNKFQFIWTKDVIQFAINGQIYHTITPYHGFWKLGGFDFNPWPQGTTMAPFDKEFFLVMNLAVGGNFFPDDARNPSRKPWRQSASAMTDFYRDKANWYSTWRGEDAALQVDYVKVFAA